MRTNSHKSALKLIKIYNLKIFRNPNEFKYIILFYWFKNIEFYINKKKN